MSQGQILIELNGLASELVCLVEDSGVEVIAIQGVDPGWFVCASQQGVGAGVVWINGTRELEETPRFVKSVHAERRVKRDKDLRRLQIIVVRLPTAGGLGASPFGFGLPDMRCEDRRDRAYYLVLDGKNVLHLAVVVLGPEMRSCCGIDELR